MLHRHVFKNPTPSKYDLADLDKPSMNKILLAIKFELVKDIFLKCIFLVLDNLKFYFLLKLVIFFYSKLP